MHYILVVLSLFLRNRGLWRPASVFSMWCDVMWTTSQMPRGSDLPGICWLVFHLDSLTTERLPVNSSHGHLVTRLTRYIRVSPHSKLVTSEQTTKPSAAWEVVFSPTKTVLNTDGLITTNEQTYEEVLELMTKKKNWRGGNESKTVEEISGLEKDEVNSDGPYVLLCSQNSKL